MDGKSGESTETEDVVGAERGKSETERMRRISLVQNALVQHSFQHRRHCRQIYRCAGGWMSWDTCTCSHLTDCDCRPDTVVVADAQPAFRQQLHQHLHKLPFTQKDLQQLVAWYRGMRQRHATVFMR